MLTEDQSVYIPIGSKHRLTNPGKLPLTLIEVQSGGYLGEDDIVRFDDVYGRLMLMLMLKSCNLFSKILIYSGLPTQKLKH
jgi:hypothetical protein